MIPSVNKQKRKKKYQELERKKTNCKAHHTPNSHGRPPHQPPCGACSRMQIRCNPDCELAPYFPRDRAEDFDHVRAVFGVTKLKTRIRAVQESQRAECVNSLVAEARQRSEDNVGGSYAQITLLRNVLADVRRQLEQQRAHRDTLAFLNAHFPPPPPPPDVGDFGNIEALNALIDLDDGGNDGGFGGTAPINPPLAPPPNPRASRGSTLRASRGSTLRASMLPT